MERPMSPKEKIEKVINAQINRIKEHVDDNNYVKSDFRLYSSMRYILIELKDLLVHIN